MGIDLPLVGGYNVENALAATGAALACKLSLEQISMVSKPLKVFPAGWNGSRARAALK